MPHVLTNRTNICARCHETDMWHALMPNGSKNIIPNVSTARFTTCTNIVDLYRFEILRSWQIDWRNFCPASWCRRLRKTMNLSVFLYKVHYLFDDYMLKSMGGGWPVLPWTHGTRPLLWYQARIVFTYFSMMA